MILFVAINTSIKTQSINNSTTIKLTNISKNNNLVGFSVAIEHKNSVTNAKVLVVPQKKPHLLKQSKLTPSLPI
jgi:hypothetical protein